MASDVDLELDGCVVVVVVVVVDEEVLDVESVEEYVDLVVDWVVEEVDIVSLETTFLG